jgi:hypothetical protein
MVPARASGVFAMKGTKRHDPARLHGMGAIILVVFLVSWSWSYVSSPQLRSGQVVRSDSGPQPLFSPAGADSSVCGAFDSMSIDAYVSNIYVGAAHQGFNTGSPPEAGVESGMVKAWGVVCDSSQFVSLVEEWGVSNLSLGLSIDWAAGSANGSFTEYWVQSGLTIEDAWLVNLTTGGISGPVVSQTQEVSTGGSSGGKTMFTTFALPWVVALAALVTLITTAAIYLLVRRGRRRPPGSPQGSPLGLGIGPESVEVDSVLDQENVPAQGQ